MALPFIAYPLIGAGLSGLLGAVSGNPRWWQDALMGAAAGAGFGLAPQILGAAGAAQPAATGAGSGATGIGFTGLPQLTANPALMGATAQTGAQSAGMGLGRLLAMSELLKIPSAIQQKPQNTEVVAGTRPRRAMQNPLTNAFWVALARLQAENRGARTLFGG